MSSSCQMVDDIALYVLGELDSESSARMQRHLSECPECRVEAEQVQGALAAMAMSAPEAVPPGSSRDRLFTALAKEPRLPLPMVTRSQIPRLVYPVRQPVWHWAPAFAAAALLIIVLILWRNDVQLQKQVTALQTAITQNEADSQKTREVVAAFTEPDAVHVTLVAAGSKPQPHGRAVFVPRKGVLVFLASNLNPLPPKKSYQLWMIPAAGGAPIPAGRFKPDQRGNAMVLSRHHLPKNSEPKNFAVTVEAEEGASTPTPPIVLVGAGD